MENDWYDYFLDALYKKYPKKSQLTEALMDLLSIERESVYRRLRKDIIFPVHELAKIAAAWNISLDEIVGINSNQVSFKVRLFNYLNPSNEELNGIQEKVQYLKYLSDIPDMEYVEISNKLPRALGAGFPHLCKFQFFKWAYQYCIPCNEERTLSYSNVFFPSKMSKLISDYYVNMKNMANTIYIWDHMLFHYLISDIRYFHSIYLITDEEKELIKKDLYDLLNYMSEAATRGHWSETGNNMSLYISYLNIDTNYSYYYSNEFKMCRVHAFAKSEIYTTNPTIIEEFRTWMHLKKRSSVKISEADEKSRIEFFIKQRELVDTL